MSKSDACILVTILLLVFLFSGEPDVFGAVKNRVIASMTDSGCSTHPHKVIEQKDIQIKDTYVDWSK